MSIRRLMTTSLPPTGSSHRTPDVSRMGRYGATHPPHTRELIPASWENLRTRSGRDERKPARRYAVSRISWVRQLPISMRSATTKGSCDMRLIIATIVTTTLALTPLFAADSDPAQRLNEAATVFEEIMATPDRGIPRDLVEKAHCIVIVPELKTAAFVFGGKYVTVRSCRSTDTRTCTTKKRCTVV